MIEPEFVKYIATLGVGGIIAGLMFMVYRKDMREYQEEWKGQREVLVTIVKENSVAITANTEVIRSLRDAITKNGAGR